MAKIIEEQIFGNPLDNKNISNDRLKTFATDAIGALAADNIANRYDAIIAELTADTDALKNEVGNVTVTAVQRESATMGVDTSLDSFIKTMSENEGVIAKLLGGKTTSAFHEFYPHGQNQYTTMTKTNSNSLFTQVESATINHSAVLGPVLEAELMALKPAYETARTLQMAKANMLPGLRTARNTNRETLEISLNKAFHWVGFLFPTNAAKASQYFHFEKLYKSARHKHLKLDGTIPAGGHATVINRAFTDLNEIHIKSVSLTADLRAIIVENPANIPMNTGEIIKANKGRNFLHKDLGPDSGTYLILFNLDPLNDAPFVVEVLV